MRSGRVKEQDETDQQLSNFTMSLIGNTRALRFGRENILLGEEELYLDLSQITPRTREVSGRCVSVINMLGLHELPQQSTDTHISHLLRDHEIHVFLYVLPLGLLTDEDKMVLDWLQRTFGEKSLDFVMIVFTYETEDQKDTVIDDLKKNAVLEQIVQKCGKRYYTCDKRLNNRSEISTLLERIDRLISQNKQACYTGEMYKKELKAKEILTKYSKSQRIYQKTRSNSDEEDRTAKKSQHAPKRGKLQEFISKENKEQKINQLLNSINLTGKYEDKLKTDDFLEIRKSPSQHKEPCSKKTMVQIFLQRLFTMDYRARYTLVREETTGTSTVEPGGVQASGLERGSDFFASIFNPKSASEAKKPSHIHPMDVQMAVFHCADRFLQQFMVTKLSQCQYALPLLVPNPFTQQIEFPLWTFHQIKKSWTSVDKSGKIISNSQPVYKAETPMVFFFRLGTPSSSKSQLMNSLINEKHNTFFHRQCRGNSKACLLMDGVVEIAWYCPSGKDTDHFSDCVAFCNLHGDAAVTGNQRKLLTEMASVSVVLISTFEANDKSKAILKELSDSPRPLICVLVEEDSTVNGYKGKFKLGLKDRNQFDVSEDLKFAIRQGLKRSNTTFKLETLKKCSGIRVDEDDKDCKRGRKAADEMINRLKDKELSSIKQKYLPCQGKPWHDWCQKNKELHRLQGNNLEIDKNAIQQDMKILRYQQNVCGSSCLVDAFVSNLHSMTVREAMYFIRWVGILLDDFSSDKLSELNHEYDEKWKQVLILKRTRNKSEQLKEDQKRLEKISNKLSAATFGLEHIMREMGQLYECWRSLYERDHKKKDLSHFPHLAAKLMISGHPMELMDGDAAHVPLIWVTAVLDEVIKRLGDQRVFVLSVLGIQSTGKSTMLNAMFGLQFAVSAGRCTRGAFMQLVRVTEEMKEELKFDYILVVDTEGLRALELAGRSTQHHDNELATFVVGLGNLTLINIMGENPAEMQDILQIVVQAFLRMKKVRLSPSCVFVHQNVGDITAREKNKEGRRRLQEKLDEMTKLAAKEEVCDAECFSDVISFDVQRDVKYFAQLWEGSPPMAPPNPHYSDNVQELKMDILSRATKSQCMTLSQFKLRIQNLWEALLNENFVFSFKNSLEIAVYRKLEEEYGKWTWSLRSAMLSTEDKLHTRINNQKLHRVEETDLVDEMRKTLQNVEQSMKQYFEESREKETLIQWKGKFQEKIKEVHNDLVKRAKGKLDDIIIHRRVFKTLSEKKTLYEAKLFERSKSFGSKLKHKASDKNELRKEFDTVWEMWVEGLTHDIPPVKDTEISKDVISILSESYEWNLVHTRQRCKEYKIIDRLTDHSSYVTKRYQLKSSEDKPLTSEEQDSIKTLITSIIHQSMDIVTSKPVSKMGYNISYIQEIIQFVKQNVSKHESPKYVFKKEFMVDLLLHVCERAGDAFAEHYKAFREANDPQIYLAKKKPEYFNVFQGFCQGVTAAEVLGGLICSGLREPILKSVYNQTANDLAGEIRANLPAFNGNRSNLEKHILKSLAEEENFDKFMLYIHNPREHFENFIRDKVNQYMTADNPKALTRIKGHIKHKQQCIITAAQTATAQVKRKKGDANMWLRNFSDSLTDELEYSKDHLSSKTCQDITDFDFLEEVVKRELNTVIEELNSSFTSLSDLNMEMFRERPDEILIKHFCQCCWEKCPFCKAICTNTIEGHTEDHSVPFHRSGGVNGSYYEDTTNFLVEFCTTSVASKKGFRTSPDLNEEFLFKEYRSAGPPYSDWSITPDLSELPYWKWFMCRFQNELEKHYNKTFQGKGEIPSEWWNYTKQDAIESLDKYM
ncbi:interferon-induced very large GTPase 1-like [Chanos chanos]|uniref:Interferon-induced very large GTPase 1-like n=1 Tax=Chanos chanos TaxID=29144 RepID=A0A6J2WY27_CHACN|nr:interferon-induced very large GTPase 1-like [Chanos chanos]